VSSFKYTFLVHFMKISIHLHIFWPDSKSTQLSLDKYRKDLHSTTTSASALFCTLCPPLHFNSFNCVKLNHKSKINYSYYNDCDDVYDFQSLNEREFPPLFAFSDHPTSQSGVLRRDGIEGSSRLAWWPLSISLVVRVWFRFRFQHRRTPEESGAAAPWAHIPAICSSCLSAFSAICRLVWLDG